jgi:hypothetical protein
MRWGADQGAKRNDSGSYRDDEQRRDARHRAGRTNVLLDAVH